MDKDITEPLEIFTAYIRKKGLRMTRQRETVVEAFLHSEGHLSTDELFELVRKKDERIGHATVFRTLKALTDCGLARETDLADGRTRFEHQYKHPQHHHIICVECNRAIEFFSPDLERVYERVVAEYDFEPVRYRFQVLGVCNECRTQQRESEHQTFEPDLVFARDALKIAMETEKRGVRFYRAASEFVEHPITRRTFLEMQEDEQSHFDGLQKEWKRLTRKHKGIQNAPVFLHFDFEALKRIFPSREEIEKKLSAGLTEEEALRLAMAMEKEAGDFFARYADRFGDTKGRDIFLKFAEEEEEHYDRIKAAYEGLPAEKS
jgi:Fur family ferric uptake transcriptional regulator